MNASSASLLAYVPVECWHTSPSHDGLEAQDDVNAEEDGNAIITTSHISLHMLLHRTKNKNRTTGPAAYLGPGLIS